ncbi:MAG: hypothetical protein PSV46_17755 [Reyranella sp.]|nr:hypothetical protein [Reyranella sp.]
MQARPDDPPDDSPDDPTNGQIALLCEIGEHDLSKLTGDEKRDLEWLLSQGYAQPAKGDTGLALQLTPKGSAFLSERGAGLNEA